VQHFNKGKYHTQHALYSKCSYWGDVVCSGYGSIMLFLHSLAAFWFFFDFISLLQIKSEWEQLWHFLVRLGIRICEHKRARRALRSIVIGAQPKNVHMIARYILYSGARKANVPCPQSESTTPSTIKPNEEMPYLFPFILGLCL
jgi:hypothetical protein